MMQETPEPEPPVVDEARQARAEPEALALARRVRAILESWSVRMTAATSGRNATTVARMATARASAELRQCTLPRSGDDGEDAALREAVAGYLRRATAAVSRAAHEIERNRYSLVAMRSELERLEEIFGRLAPAAPDEDSEGDKAGRSAETGSGADDGGADREVSPR